jgi:hypothetical protein
VGVWKEFMPRVCNRGLLHNCPSWGDERLDLNEVTKGELAGNQ